MSAQFSLSITFKGLTNPVDHKDKPSLITPIQETLEEGDAVSNCKIPLGNLDNLENLDFTERVILFNA
jgi:hypothetical protein